MERFIIFYSFLFICSMSAAQDAKSIVGFSIGAAIPVGDFASKDIDNASAGWGKTGTMLDFSYSFLWENNLGIEIVSRSQYNAFDAEAMQNQLTLLTDENLLITANNWQLSSLLVGVRSSFGSVQKTHFGGRFLMGLNSTTSPEQTFNSYSNNSVIWLKQISSSSLSFSYLVGFNMSFDLGEKMLLKVNLDYLGSNPEFSYVETLVSDGKRYFDTWSQSTGTLSIGFGLSWKLNCI